MSVSAAAVSAALGPIGAHLRPIDAGAERVVAGTGEHHDAHVVVMAQGRPHFLQFEAHRIRERVAALGSIERDPRDAVGFFVEQGVERAHGYVYLLRRSAFRTLPVEL